MTTCDMCGSKADQLFKTKIEGTVLDVCKGCSRFGEVVQIPRFRPRNAPESRPQNIPKRKEVLQLIVTDYAEKIRKAREKLGLTQEEFAKRLNEKWSIMQKIEGSQFRPSISQARKLEEVLKISLIETHDEKGEVPIAAPKKGDEGFTLGDFIKKR